MVTKTNLQWLNIFLAIYIYVCGEAQKLGDRWLRFLEKEHRLFHQLDWSVLRQFPQTSIQDRQDIIQQTLLTFWDNIEGFYRWLDSQDIDLNDPRCPQICINYLKTIAFRRMVDLYHRTRHHLSLDVNLGDQEGMTFLDYLPDQSLEPLEQLINQEQRQFLQDIIRDRDGQFAKIRSRKYPACTLPRLVQELSTGDTFQQVSNRLDMPLVTLTSFWYRHAKKVA